MQNRVQFYVSLKLKSNINNFEKTISCIILPQITNYIPTSPLHSTNLNIPKKLAVADPNFDKPAPIDLLIGADTFWDLLCIGQVKLGDGLPTLQKTKLGWLVSGPLYAKQQNFTTRYCGLSMRNSLDSQVAKFWELEDYPKKRFFSDEEEYCEKYFKDTLCQNEEGRFHSFQTTCLCSRPI
ncbi:hypothetical protein JTB14_014638 [Gonioctena quinquepunctata]|nr:hypothetical protein JTB14_014638 [Gonioctena quinquepunctata]